MVVVDTVGSTSAIYVKCIICVNVLDVFAQDSSSMMCVDAVLDFFVAHVKYTIIAMKCIADIGRAVRCYNAKAKIDNQQS